VALRLVMCTENLPAKQLENCPMKPPVKATMKLPEMIKVYSV